jgi:hypothetical protein
LYQPQASTKSKQLKQTKSAIVNLSLANAQMPPAMTSQKSWSMYKVLNLAQMPTSVTSWVIMHA